jgi:hypothetical protein
MNNTKKIIFNIRDGLKLVQELSFKNKKTKNGYVRQPVLAAYLKNKE